uniref:Fe2OG dioxygenase domain-containing protein n=1 Tax=Chromera velia CCMP2878 TaxID=1169474 RepID=A0A0G4I6L0_9ALVE|mmetsp:Transcript_47551/g.93834  ORF Transcript_47551/g.93834 Transcript_47551/m.93834 type:complete len:491 (-) Transcript_47551:182-1654(-)|eukprot:Cvel_11423.t1-p1 / transcript=Cvel_11423.t1 / gene=Cvel_11423 / organism=Chromera_velia_CCMP2878 / gene_product=Probable iron/ascorbate oxidoreductase DDB_G0283291, putative / transcript_product=Probable iron/ascorbate oxidoreductase DDB_G0283291, putative / location=Cvel_scaffold718:12265-14978(-) / protein_length=490 / sequence_SO=supercontig / SO=protein_coding / is_pseudo=false
MTTTTSSILPSIDLDDESCENLDLLRDTCREIGFFYLRLSPETDLVCQRAAEAARSFFETASDEEKRSIENVQSPAFRGFIRYGAENTGGKADLREQIEIGPDEDITVTPEDQIFNRLRGKNLWPGESSSHSGLKRSIEAFLGTMENLSRRLTRLLSLSLRMEADSLDVSVIGPHPHFQAKAAFYPSVRTQAHRSPVERDSSEEGEKGDAEARGESGEGADMSLGVGAHTDSGFLTLLWQDGPGLQALLPSHRIPPTAGAIGDGQETDGTGSTRVQSDDAGAMGDHQETKRSSSSAMVKKQGGGKWVDVPPVAGSVVVNLGEMLQLATGGLFKATPHRVLPPSPNSRGRVSLPFFWNPSLDQTVTDSLSRQLLLSRHTGNAALSPPPILDQSDSQAESSLVGSVPQVKVGGRGMSPLPGIAANGNERKSYLEAGAEAADIESFAGRKKNRLIAQFGMNAFKSLARSHPEVMKRHHPDLRVCPDGTVVRLN